MKSRCNFSLYASIIVLFLFNCQDVLGQDEIEKMRIFYKYDEKFHTNLDGKLKNIEKRFHFELYDPSLITPGYREKAIEYKQFLNDYIKGTSKNSYFFRERKK